MPVKIDAYTELIVKMDFLSNSINKIDESLKDVLLEQRTSSALMSQQREKLMNVEKLLSEEKEHRKEEVQSVYDYVRENEQNTLNKMKVWAIPAALSVLVTIGGLVLSFIK